MSLIPSNSPLNASILALYDYRCVGASVE